jgi:hypothetical protein
VLVVYATIVFNFNLVILSSNGRHFFNFVFSSFYSSFKSGSLNVNVLYFLHTADKGVQKANAK